MGSIGAVVSNLSFFEELEDFLTHLLRFRFRCPITDHATLSVQQKLAKVPGDGFSVHVWRVCLHVFIQGVSVLTDGIDRSKQRIRVSRPCILLRVPDFHHGTGVWLLLPKLIAREAENLETLVSMLTVQLSELVEVKPSQASGAGEIADDNCFLVLEEFSELRMHKAIHILNRSIENVLNCCKGSFENGSEANSTAAHSKLQSLHKHNE